jgi:hypothetical protein
MLAARLEAESEPPSWDRREACNFPRSPLNERMRALLDRLDTDQNAVTGQPPTRVSFSKIVEWREGAAGIPAPQTYRDLLQSYLSGAFEGTLVFYLTNSAPDLSKTELAGYRMTRNFLAARTITFSPDDPKNAGALFEAYLAPCWIHRAVAVRWLEAKGYPVPPGWKQTVLSARSVSPKVRRKAGAKAKYDWWAVTQYLFEQLNEKGDFDEPDQTNDWKSQADVVRSVVKYLEKHGPKDNEGHPIIPANSTLNKRVSEMVAKWRRKQASDN